ncbi:hypothetical protein [Paenibacillus glycanilyticus]|uniref:DUF4367 domain-containing protein n=1 Tax=Paenibacillus glycanilyticus TaxID=126569 RepID=A0ABQ6GC99_9BACL|nr:hypothetical protein [Paenibacillus glycanilyticus]GLX67880.1 hypothetical protein MU1_22250 [Paenibacillus glycanilyticus]
MTNDERKQINLPTEEETNDAWTKLELKLKEQTGSPVWGAWAKDGATAEDTIPRSDNTASSHLEGFESLAKGRQEENLERGNEQKPRPSKSRSWIRKHGMKTSVAAAAVLICAAIALPSTNEALAAILGKFKMNQVAVVQEDDFKTALQGFFGSDISAESSNKFGKFERTVIGEGANDLSVSQTSEKYGIDVPEKLVTPFGNQKELHIYGMQGEAITFSLNVDEINNVMKKLGAEKLLPASVDGKAITLRMGEGVSVDYGFIDSDEQERYVHLTISPAPVIEMDPSIQAEDAYEALIRFPVLPTDLKNVLMQSTRISEGEVPFPIITNGHVTKSVMEGIDVYFENGQAWGNGWNATWLDNGMVKQASMYNAKSREDAEMIVKELITK